MIVIQRISCIITIDPTIPNDVVFRRSQGQKLMK